jgi:hypothetical protein
MRVHRWCQAALSATKSAWVGSNGAPALPTCQAAPTGGRRPPLIPHAPTAADNHEARRFACGQHECGENRVASIAAPPLRCLRAGHAQPERAARYRSNAGQCAITR